MERGDPLQCPLAHDRRARQARRHRSRRFPARVPDHLPRRVLPCTDIDALPQPHGDGRGRDDPGSAHRRRGAALELRQDHSCDVDGRRIRGPASDHRHRRSAAQGQLARRRTRLVHRLPTLLVGTPRRQYHASRIRLDGGGDLPFARALHGDGHREHHVRHLRSSRHDTPRRRGHTWSRLATPRLRRTRRSHGPSTSSDATCGRPIFSPKRRSRTPR